MQLWFFVTAPLNELIRNWRFGCAITTDLQNQCLNEVFDPTTQRTLANFQPMPELRHRGGEFKRNIAAPSLRRNGYDDALLRLIVSLVCHHYSLAGLDTTRHQDQSASSTDGDCQGLLVKRIAAWQRAVDKQREMSINPARNAAIRVLSSGCFSHFVVLALERNNSTQFTPACKAGLLVEGTVWKNWTACLELRGLRPTAAEKRMVLQGEGHMGRRKYRSHLAVRPVEVPADAERLFQRFSKIRGMSCNGLYPMWMAE
jgi:hypothetical protein